MNKRVKTRPEIQVPVRSLLEIFTTSSQCSPFASVSHSARSPPYVSRTYLNLQNFSIMYIKMGFMRLKADSQVELIPLLFQSLPNRSTPHQELLMGLIVYALQNVKIIPNSNENIVKYGLVQQPVIRHLFLNFLLNILLLQYKCVTRFRHVHRMHRTVLLSLSLRFEDTKARSIAIGSQRAHVEPSQAPVDEVLFSTMDDAPSKEAEVFKQPFPCMNETLHNRITEAIQTDDLNQVEKVGRNEHRPITSCRLIHFSSK